MPNKARKSALFAVICLAIAGALPAQETPRQEGATRPRIGLVLSGGGARGAAHIGVLKVLEENHVPVDAIAGTSMGAVVGGLYASGLSAKDIERIMTSVDWQDAFRDRPSRADLNFRRKLEDQNFLVKFPLGLKGRKFRLPRGLVQGQKLTQILRGLTLPVAQVQSFDDLAIPFRAIATDIVTGDRVVLDHGDLTTAMRASLSAPGVFSPVDSDGRMLVDGGLSSNLPIDVAREMGVDILIVVDCGFPLLERGKLVSVATVSNQMLAILIRRNSAEQRKTLKATDVVIDPALGDFSTFDFTEHEKAMRIGEQAARGQVQRLAALGVSPEEFQRIVDARGAKRSDLPTIKFLRVEEGSEKYAGAIEALFGDQVGKVVNPPKLARRAAELYGQGNLEIFDYRLAQAEPVDGADPEYGLALTTRRNSWGPNYLRFGLALQNDFEGNSSFNAAARGTLAEITKYGGEWTWDVQVGETPRLATEIYLPAGYRSRWFLAPHAQFQIRTLPLADANEHILAEYRVRTTDFGLDLGRELGNYGEIRVGAGRTIGSARVRIGDPLLPPSEFDSHNFFSEFRYDTLDNVNFPHHGASFQLGWQGEREGGGDSESADLMVFDQLYAHSWGRNTAMLWTTAGTRLDSDVDIVRSFFSLGGFLNMSGIAPDTLVGPHFAIARAIYYRQVGQGGQGFLNVPVYLGASIEKGNVWSARSDISWGSAKTNGSLFLGMDTLLGPVYFATGFDDGGSSAYYLFLGRTF
ncbi:MAG TPA: patatin-like phospholipase family protein [Steroidobacteraceae bacterium]|jgi:NTE family protein|nr:patatin-like phospholipase family protein [Steroidobacteraceae bacterium]